jgi:nucleoside-diphosphate-sugar epimerase
MAAEQIFVTGASGFIGGALTTALIADGATVKALARSDAAAAKIEALGAEPVRGDLGAPGDIRTAAAGCELAFHAAALPTEWGTKAEFEAANVTGTANVLGACAEAGVSRFVHVGTEAACFAMKPLVRIDETAPLQPDSPVLYSATKARAEQLVIGASKPGFETIVLRPRLVWGPGDVTVLPGFVDAVESGRFSWVSGGTHLTSTSHIDNVVHGLRLAAEKGRAGEAYFVTDGEPVVFRDFITRLLATRGVTPPDKNLPAPLARVAAVTSEALWRLLPLPGSPPMTRLAYFLIANEVTIDIAKARAELGYEPLISVDRGLSELASAAV